MRIICRRMSVHSGAHAATGSIVAEACSFAFAINSMRQGVHDAGRDSISIFPGFGDDEKVTATQFLSARLDPSCERRLTFTRGSSRNQSLDGDVVVEFRPVNPLTAADQSPFGPFVRCPMDEARI